MIFITSDWHFGHDIEFIYKNRGFSSVEEMGETLIEKHNSCISQNDDVFVLGDLTLGDYNKGKSCIRRLNGKLHVILGNHDTRNRQIVYFSLSNVVEILHAKVIRYKRHEFYLSHYPSLTGNLHNDDLSKMIINLYGHTHQRENNFFNDLPYMYHCGVDSHNMYPITLDSALDEMYNKIEHCKTFL